VGSYPNVVLDMDGQPRTGSIDVGADQASDAPITRRPITANDAGPDWMRAALAVNDRGDTPANIDVLDNFPNPFNPSTTIRFTLRTAQEIRLRLYDVAGRHVRDLYTGQFEAGSHEVVWLADREPSGVYLVVLQTEDGLRTRKAVLLK
jgi:hypothetical protein